MFNKLKANKDLWELFTSLEEYNPELLDQYQRFPYYFSKQRTVFEPCVSAFLINNGLKINYPNGKKFAVCLTHDIDSVYFPFITIGNEIIQALLQKKVGKSLNIAVTSIVKFLLSVVKKDFNPARNFNRIIDLEKKYGAKSSFYFLLSDNKSRRFEGCKIEGLKKELRKIVAEGWEIGLHGGYDTYIELEKIKNEKERLEKTIGSEVIGYRNHFLRFKTPTTWELLKTAGFKYDTTFGYADCVGFRNGMCHPFRPYNIDKSEYIDIWEIPLTIMDRTLSNYMQLGMSTSWKIAKRLIDTVEEYNGVITILWHHTSMTGAKGELYERILKYSFERNAWMTSAKEIWLQVCDKNDRQ